MAHAVVVVINLVIKCDVKITKPQCQASVEEKITPPSPPSKDS